MAVSRPKSALEVVDVDVILGGRSILSGLNLTLERGACATIMGSSGSGKSTLLSAILGMVRPKRGSILVGGIDVPRAKSRDLARIRRKTIGTVFQGAELLPELTPVENVAVAALLDDGQPADAFTRALELLNELGVPCEGVLTGDLSGGERQRTAVARALINRPELVIADEPTGALDSTTRDSVADLLFSIPAVWGAALLVVTHDQAIATRGDSGYVMELGRLSSVARSN